MYRMRPVEMMKSKPQSAATPRDTSRDGLRNKIEDFLLTRGRPFWGLVNRHAWLSRILNRVIVNNAVRKAPFRPLRLSTMDDYPSWSSLTDRTWFSRYLPPKEMGNLPPLDTLEQLYIPRPGGPRLSDRSTLLFPTFAQWFTDGFLMTSATDPRRTTTNHQIDLGQLYGLNDDVQRALRLFSEERGRRGRLLSETDNGEEWAPRLFKADGERDPRFDSVPDPDEDAASAYPPNGRRRCSRSAASARTPPSTRPRSTPCSSANTTACAASSKPRTPNGTISASSRPPGTSTSCS